MFYYVDNIHILNPLDNGTLQNTLQFRHFGISPLSKEYKQILIAQNDKNKKEFILWRSWDTIKHMLQACQFLMLRLEK